MGGLVTLTERFRRELSFDDWANREVLRHLQRESQPPASCVRWLAHVLGAQCEWLARLRGEKSPLPVWPSLTLDELELELGRLQRAWSEFLSTLDPDAWTRSITYVNSKGQSWSSRVEDVLTHVLLHGAHHRGQIACALREADLSVPAMDYIHATRRGLLD